MRAAPQPGSTYLYESWAGRLALTIFPAGVLAIFANGSDGGMRVAAIVCLGLLVLSELVRIRRPVATLTPTMIVVHNLRPHEISWHRITDVTSQKKFGARRIAIEIDTGTRVVMDGPTGVAARDHFDRTLATIRQAWLERRGSSRPAQKPETQQPETQQPETQQPEAQ